MTYILKYSTFVCDSCHKNAYNILNCYYVRIIHNNCNDKNICAELRQFAKFGNGAQRLHATLNSKIKCLVSKDDIHRKFNNIGNTEFF